MRYRKLDENGDMLFGDEQADFFRDQPEAVAQAVWTRLRLWAGEWFLDTAEGTPYQQAALGTNKQETIGPALRERILETQGVTEIEEFELTIDPDNRVASLSAVINTQYGSTQLVGVL
jgi:hypothetical protein